LAARPCQVNHIGQYNPLAVFNILLTLIFLLQNQTKSLNKYGKYRGSNGATKLALSPVCIGVLVQGIVLW